MDECKPLPRATAARASARAAREPAADAAAPPRPRPASPKPRGLYYLTFQLNFSHV